MFKILHEFEDDTFPISIFPQRLVSMLIEVAERCEVYAGKSAANCLSIIIKEMSTKQTHEMVEINIHYNLLALLKHSNFDIQSLSAMCIAELLNNLLALPPTEHTIGKNVNRVMKDVVEWLRREERKDGWLEMMQEVVQIGNPTTVEMMMMEGLGEILGEILVSLRKKGGDESQFSAETLPRLWEKGMKTENKEETERWRRLIQVMAEEDGEDNGMMDGMVGMSNNFWIRERMYDFDETVFGGGDIAFRTFSVRRLFAFQG